MNCISASCSPGAGGGGGRGPGCGFRPATSLTNLTGALVGLWVPLLYGYRSCIGEPSGMVLLGTLRDSITACIESEEPEGQQVHPLNASVTNQRARNRACHPYVGSELALLFALRALT